MLNVEQNIQNGWANVVNVGNGIQLKKNYLNHKKIQQLQYLKIILKFKKLKIFHLRKLKELNFMIVN